VEMYANENIEQPWLPTVRQGRQLNHWTKPLVDTLKLNCDASYQATGIGSWGALIRDSDGDLVLSRRGRMDHVLSPFHAELIACLQGIQMAVDLGIGRILVETDAQEVARAIKLLTLICQLWVILSMKSNPCCVQTLFLLSAFILVEIVIEPLISWLHWVICVMTARRWSPTPLLMMYLWSLLTIC
jgi:hypothetical protein